jgi:N-methylhydantoinase B
MTAQPEGSTGFADPITFEVFRNSLTGLANEMGLVILRSAHSPTLTHALDFSTALCDHMGRVLVQGNSMMVHIGTFPAAMDLLIERWGHDLAPQDLFIFNDEDSVAQHLPDIYAIQPYFSSSETLIGFGICSAHHVDIGGQNAGGVDVLAATIYAEGLQIPLIKLYERGKINQSVLEIMRRNVRTPDMLVGDLSGQRAALQFGETGLRQLVELHSLPVFQRLSAELLDYSERLTRAEIRGIPDGRYQFEDWIDDDGRGGGPTRLLVTVTVRDDEVTVDWSGSGEQVPTGMNCQIANTRSISYGALQTVFVNEVQCNDGFRRAISVSAPPNTIVNASRPAARGARGLTIYRVLDTVLGALGQAVPDRVPAAADGGPAIVRFAGVDATGTPFLHNLGPWISGWGGRMGADGNDHASPLGANFATIPLEELESEAGLQVTHQRFVVDSEGPGQWRGCFAVELALRFYVSGSLQLLTQRRTVRPYGLADGGLGSPSSNTLVRDGKAAALPINVTFDTQPGDVVTHVHASGGGWGDALLRDPDAIWADLVDKKITPEHALDCYGVATYVGADGELLVDHEQTAELRAAGRRGESGDRAPSSA